MRWLRRRKTEEIAGRLFSPEALRRAWQVIRRNGPTPGVDGVSIREFERHLNDNLDRLRRDLMDGSYEPLPVRRIYVPKAGDAMRPLAIWALRDRVAQRVVHEYLLALMEPRFLDCSYGFRPGRSVGDAVNAILEARNANRRWVVDADIKDCFDSLDVDRLMGHVRMYVSDPVVTRLIEKWLRTQVHNPGWRGKIAAGASQGGVISPLLANLYLHSFDQWITERLAEETLVRFADDFVILCQKRSAAMAALNEARVALRQLRLRLNAHKTRIVHFDEGFRFLGVFFLRNEHFYLQ